MASRAHRAVSVARQRRGSVARTARASVRVVAAGALAGSAGLLFWTLLPLVWGWTPCVVMSGSMTPAVRPGDVVLVGADPRPAPGQILAVHSPAWPGQLLIHRMVGWDASGAVVTRGDANSKADVAVIAPERVRGAVRLRVPYVGLPVLWLRHREVLPFLGWLLGTGAVALLATGRSTARDAVAAGKP